jgi:uncharacterized protein YbjT (DUF2867 family)
MKIVVIGATGNIGQRIAKEARVAELLGSA